MDNKDPKEVVHGYEIKRAIVFENDRGFALGENPAAVAPFVTWQFTQDENGTKDYYWGHYFSNKDTATRDYENRVTAYHKDYGLSEMGAYKYYSTQRPVDIGTFPKTENGPVRFENFDVRKSVELGHYRAWGYLIYDAPLTEKQIDDYEFHASLENPDVKQSMDERVQIIGIWEEEHKIPDDKRFTWHSASTQGFALREPAATPKQLEKRYFRAIKDLAHTVEKPTVPKPIAEQLAEAAKQIERGAGADAPAKKQNKSHEDR